MRELHSLLKRQLRRFANQTDPDPDLESELLKAINEAYWQFDSDRKMLERSMELTSQELLEINLQLGKSNSELEERVAKRTADLNIANEQLRLELAERKRAEEALSSERNLLQLIMDNIPDTVYSKDMASRFTRINKAQAKVLGLADPADAYGKTDADFQPAALAEMFFVEEQKILSNGESIVDRTEFNPTPDGQPRWFSATKVAIKDQAGRVIGLIGVSRDITERMQAEEVVRQYADNLEQKVEERTAELMRANRAKDEFLSGMSHELRTPLNAVLSISESLEEGVYGELKPRQIEVMHIIAESGRHLLELINDILDLAKIGADKLELQAEPVIVESLCQTSMRMIKETAFKKHLQISMSNTSNIEVIHADQRRLKQMLVNLLSNAVKFTPAGGQVGLEVSREGDHALRFSVWDTGIGISADQFERLFQPFVQLDSSLSRQYAGTGLGLALVSNLAELHGGSVGVESEPGKGSRFYFIIPTQLLNAPIMESAKPAAELKPNETTITDMGEKWRILLVEDNVTNMLVTSDYLNDKGYQVIGARDGLEAIEYAIAQKPDLILMDIQMPGIDGLEAIKRIRAVPGFDSVPIIAFTALAMPGDRERCLSAGANEYLSKPVSLKGLIQLIENLLKGIA